MDETARLGKNNLHAGCKATILGDPGADCGADEKLGRVEKRRRRGRGYGEGRICLWVSENARRPALDFMYVTARERERPANHQAAVLAFCPEDEALQPSHGK